MRRLLSILATILLVGITVSCATDESEPSSDEEIASSADETAADASAGAGTEELADKGAIEGIDELADNGKPSDEQDLESELEKSDEGLEPEISKTEEPPAAEPQSPVETEALGAPAGKEKVRITNIRYLSNQAGGTVVIEATGPLSYHAHAEAGQFIINVDNAELPSKLQHPYPVHDFSGAFSNLEADQANGQTRIVVQLKSASAGEPIVQTEGNSLLVVPSSAPMVTETAATSGQPPPSTENQPLAAKTLDEFLTGNQHFYGKPVSIQTKDADIRDVINFIAEDSGANIVMSDDVKGKISVKIRKIPWDQALVTIMRTKKLGYVRQGNVLRISSMGELQEESDAALKMIETQKNLEPVMVRVIPVNYGDVNELMRQIKAFLSKEGQVVADLRSNSLLITEREKVLDKVMRIIKALDVQPNQVMIEGKIVEATESFSSSVGVNWGFTGSPLTLSQGGGYSGSPVELTPNLQSSPATGGGVLNSGLQIGTLDFFGTLNASLALSENDGLVKVISSPRIATMNREKAEITQAGEQITLSTTVGGIGGDTRTTQPVRTPITLDLTVTPQITSDSSVIMDVDVKRQFPGQVVDQATQAAPINTRTAHTKILVRNGQTAVIAGIYQNQDTQGDTGVPGLMDVPVIGWLFKARTKAKEKNELLIFLTPKIMQQTGAGTELTGAG